MPIMLTDTKSSASQEWNILHLKADTTVTRTDRGHEYTNKNNRRKKLCSREAHNSDLFIFRLCMKLLELPDEQKMFFFLNGIREEEISTAKGLLYTRGVTYNG
jgi:hypothetical protein